MHFVIGTANKCDGINNAKVFILTSNRQSCAARIHLSPARSGTCSPNRTRTGQVLSQSQLLAMAKRRSSRMSCILCYFPTESTSSPSSSSSCALLKLCSLSLLLAPVLAGRGASTWPGAALEMSMLPMAVHKVLSQLKKGAAAELCSPTDEANGIHYWMRWQPLKAAAKLEMHVKYRTQITLSTPELFVACQVKWEGQRRGLYWFAVCTL